MPLAPARTDPTSHTGESTSTPLAQDVVVACDGSWQSTLALDGAAREAGRRGVRLVVLTVMVEEPEGSTNLREWARVTREARETAEFVAAAARQRVAEVEPTVDVTTVVAPNVTDPVVASTAERAGLLALGRRGAQGRGVFLLGSMSDELARRFSCPLLVCRDARGASHVPPVRRPEVIVGINSVDDIVTVLPVAAEAARVRSVALCVLRAQDGPAPQRDVILDQVWEWMGDAMATFRQRSERQSWMSPRLLITSGTPVAALVEHAEPDDLIVTGTRGSGRLAGLIAGSVARGVLDRMPCDVLIVRDTSEEVATPREPT